MEQLRLILEKAALKSLNKSSIYGLNKETIQLKKFKNAKDIHELANEKVLLIYDDTLFGSAKDGIIFTNKAIYWRQMLGEPQKLTYSQMVESTANENSMTKTIWVLDKVDSIQVKDNYYHLIWQLRKELIASFIAYETYYYSAIDSFEQSLMEFAKKGQFDRIIEWINKYEGLFLKEEDKSAKIREILFQAYFSKKEFSNAQKELELLKETSPEFYKKTSPLLQSAMKEQEYQGLELERLKAMENGNFQQAYLLFEQQISLYIREQAYLDQVELEIKESHYKSLDKKREEAFVHGEYEAAQAILERQKKLKMRTSKQIEELSNSMNYHKYNRLDKERLNAIIKEEYHIAFFLLEKQRQLKVKKESEINEIRDSMKRLKKRVLEKYHEKLKVLVSHKSLVESKQMIDQIRKIEPSYPIEREEILLMIYQSRLEEAKELIALIPDSSLKIELETMLARRTQALYEKIREGVKRKDYDYFKSTPGIWDAKDEYGMSVLHYFALEGDVEGVAIALEKTDLSFIRANVFGHNFLDLLGIACDPQFGAKKENILDILENLRQRVNLKQIEDRLEFLRTGKVGSFFSYYLSQEFLAKMDKKEVVKIQEARLTDLNKRLMSMSYFLEVFKELKNQRDDKLKIDAVVKDLLAKELKTVDGYPKKDEFETSKEYETQCQIFTQHHLGNTGFLERYKDQNQPIMEGISKVLKRRNSGYVVGISALVEYQEKGLEALEFVQTTEGLLELFNLYFPIKAPAVELGNYDIDKEAFYIIVDKKIKEMQVPLSIAKGFKNAFDKLEFSYHRFAKNGLVMDACIYEFEGHKLYFVDYIRGVI